MKTLMICFFVLLALQCSFAYAGDKAGSIMQSMQPPDLKAASSAELITSMSDKNALYRSAAAQELGRRKVSSAASGLKVLLQDNVLAIRVDAAEALLAIGDKSGMPALRNIIKDTQATPTTALRAAKALAAAGDDTGLALANSQLQNKYSMNRVTAINALNSNKNDEIAYAALQIGLNDPAEEVKTFSLGRLGERPNLRSLKMIEPSISDENDGVRVMAHGAIIKTRLWGGIPFVINTLADKNWAIRGVGARYLNCVTGYTIKASGLISDDKVASDLQKEWQKWWEENSGLHPTDYIVPKPEEKPQTGPKVYL